MSVTAEELQPLWGLQIKVNRGGPEAVEGILIGIQVDHFTLLLPKGEVVYIANRHVKSVSNLSDQPWNGIRKAPAFVRVPYFVQLLRALAGRTVQINRGGPEKIVGVIRAIYGSSVVLKSGRELVLVQIGHIKSVEALRAGQGNNSQQNQSSSNQNQKNNKNQSNNKSNKKSNNKNNKR